MFFKRFKYDVKANVEMSGGDLFVFYFCSSHHYDAECQNAGKHGGFLFGMVNRLQADIKQRKMMSVPVAIKSPRVMVQRAIFELDDRQIQTMLKCLELASQLDEIAVRAFALKLTLQEVLDDLYEESERINGDRK